MIEAYSHQLYNYQSLYMYVCMYKRNMHMKIPIYVYAQDAHCVLFAKVHTYI